MEKIISRRNLIGSFSLLILILGIFISLEENHFQEKSKKRNNDLFINVNDTKTIKYSFPNRPFDTNVTLEGIGWHDGRFIAIISTKFYNENYYSYMPRFFSPTLEYQDKKYILVDKLWTDGALDGYKDSVTRYAVTSKRTTFSKDFWPEKITMMGIEFAIPDRTSVKVEMPIFKIEKDRKYTINASIKEETLTYTIKSLAINHQGGQLILLVNSKEEKWKEQNIFLLQDDQSRIYTFKKSSLPPLYEKGVNTFTLELNQPLPHDIKYLEFIKFKDEFVQSHLYTISNEKRIKILEKSSE